MLQTTMICSSKYYWLTSVVGLTALLLTGVQASAEESDSLRRTATVRAIQLAEPAVVNIEGNKPASTASGGTQQVNGMGAGVIIDARGYILTNQHVVQDVGRIEVTLHNGTQYEGKLIDRDQATDLALIKISSRTDLPVIRCGTSSDLMRGERVIAIGNPFGYHHTVTEGIISALHRDIPVNGVQDYPDLIQTDASINPGNSGGPLLNADGDMVGINAAVRIGAQGIGFAIPVDRAIEIAADMIAKNQRGAFDNPARVATRYGDGKSWVEVVSSSTSELRGGDVIEAIDGQKLINRLDFELALLGLTSGREISFEIRRDGAKMVSNVPLGSRTNSRVQLASSGSAYDQVSRDQIFRTLGMQLESADPSVVRRTDDSYKGGLRVTSVRHNSPAYVAQIQQGDILVGLMEWQTPDWEDLAWILRSSQMRTASEAKFHIMRGTDVFWGTLDLGATRVR